MAIWIYKDTPFRLYSKPPQFSMLYIYITSAGSGPIMAIRIYTDTPFRLYMKHPQVLYKIHYSFS
jgi:hypothetical protein